MTFTAKIDKECTVKALIIYGDAKCILPLYVKANHLQGLPVGKILIVLKDKNLGNSGWGNRRPAIIQTVNISKLIISYYLIGKIVHLCIEATLFNKMSAGKVCIEKGSLYVFFTNNFPLILSSLIYYTFVYLNIPRVKNLGCTPM